MSKNKDKAFTLVELAIVLIVIAIFLGVIWKGSSLLFSSRETETISWINAWIAELERYNDRVVNPPPESHQAPNETLYIKYGSYTTSSYKTNIIAVCNSPDCSTNLSNDTKILAKMLETQYNDQKGASVGGVRGAINITVSGQKIGSISIATATDTNWENNYKAIIIFYEKINTSF